MRGYTPARAATVSLDLACRRGEFRRVESLLTTHMPLQTLAIEPHLDKLGEYRFHPCLASKSSGGSLCNWSMQQSGLLHSFFEILATISSVLGSSRYGPVCRCEKPNG
jgi:hypothetical protein